jgi:hypothetical protein
MKWRQLNEHRQEKVKQQLRVYRYRWIQQWIDVHYRAVVFNLFQFAYPQICWCIIQVKHNL